MGRSADSVGQGRKAAIAAAIVAAMLIAAPAANAQSAADQYSPTVAGATSNSPVPDPQGVIASGSKGNGSGNGGETSSGGSVAGEATGGGGGKLPFTGYPLTTIVWIALLLLLAGLAVRVAVPRLDRRRA
jgi:hypothetical protein